MKRWQTIAGLAVVTMAMVMVITATAAEETATERVDYRGQLLIQLGVSDLDAAIHFYTEVLGLELAERRDDLEWARVETGIAGVTIGLGRRPQVAGSGTVSLNLSVADTDRARRLLEARGVVFDGPTIEIPGVVRLADFKDPDGNRIRLASPPGEGS